MDDETRPCASCEKLLPSDASFCSACGAAQEPAAASGSGSSAFELIEAEPAPAPDLLTGTGEVGDAPPETAAIDSDLLEIEFDDVDDEDAVSEEADSEEAVSESRDGDADAPPAPESDGDEAPGTSQTVRMKVSDVIHAWNEDAGVEEDAPGPAGAPAKGLPRGAMVAIVAIIAIMATLLYFLA